MYLECVQWNTRAFNLLVFDPTTKELVKERTMSKLCGQTNNNLIGDKGIFILLHG